MAWAGMPKARAPRKLRCRTLLEALLANAASGVRSAWDSCICRWARARGSGQARCRLARRGAAARHLRGVPGAGFRRLLGPCRRQPHLSVAPVAGAAIAPAITVMSRCCCAKASSTKPRCTDIRMRNYVECCLGGDAALPEMTISSRRTLKNGDVLLLCTDGLWANLDDQDFVQFAQTLGSRCAIRSMIWARRRVECLGALQRQHQRRGAALDRRHDATATLRPRRPRAERIARAEVSSAASRSTLRVRCWSSFGDTRVLCTASVEDGVPRFLARPGPGLGHRRVRHAAARHPYPLRRARRRAASRPAARRRSNG